MPDLADPTIAMQVRGPSAAGAINPFDLFDKAIGIQRGMLDLQKGQLDLYNAGQIIGARQRAGQIMSTAKTTDEGIKNMLADPSITGYAPDIIQGVQGARASQVATQGEMQTQAMTAQQRVFQALGAGVDDYTLAAPSVDAAFATFSPAAKQANQGAYDGIKKVLASIQDDPSVKNAASPEEAKANGQALFRKTVNAFMLSAGVDPARVWAQNNVPAPQLTGEPVAPVGGLPNAGAGTSGAEVSPGEASMKSKELAILGETEAELNRQASELPDIGQRMKTLQKSITDAQGFAAGGGADYRAAIASAAQAAGLPQNIVDQIGNQSLSQTQLFNTFIRPMMVQQLAAVQKGLGRSTAMELNSVIESLSSSTDPRAINEAFNVMQRMASITGEQADHVAEFRRALVDPKDPMHAEVSKYGGNGYFDWFNHTVGQRSKAELDDEIKTLKGLGISEQPESAVKGAQPEAGKPKGPNPDRATELRKRFGITE